MDGTPHTTDELADRMVRVLCQKEGVELTEDLRASLFSELRPSYAHFDQPLMPMPSDSCVISLGSEKTAALFYDRVWNPGNSDVPSEVRFYGATQIEAWTQVGISSMGKGFDIRPLILDSPIDEYLVRKSRDPHDVEISPSRMIAEALEQKYRWNVSAMYPSEAGMMQEYKPGDRRLLLAAIEGLDIIDEKHLTWEQVMECRQDKAAIMKLRTLRHWLDSDMVGKPLSFVTDALGIRLEEYKRSLRKYGLKTVAGSMSSLLDHKFLLGLSSVTGLLVASNHLESAGIGAVAAALAKVGVSVTERFIEFDDLRHGPGAEVAFIYEMEKKTKARRWLW